jgi:hypothetical protein
MQKPTVKAIVQVGESTITFEGPEEFVQAQVARFAGLNIGPTIQGKRIKGLLETSMSDTERDFVRAKNPQNHPETVAVLAFYLTQSGQAEFTEEDIRNAYIRAGIKPPKVVSQAIRDSKNNFEYIVHGTGRGNYRLSHHGDRTVRFDLPRRDVPEA